MRLPSVFLLLAVPLFADEAAVVERHPLYEDGPVGGARVSSWKMSRDERDGGATQGGRHLWLNDDWAAEPWAGVVLRNGRQLALTREWLDHGFARFRLNATVDRYGHPAGELGLQVRPEGAEAKYVRLPGRFIGQGRGRDEDEASWQEVLVPLALWRELEPGDRINGLSIQTVHQATLAFGIDEVGFVRFDRVPDWYRAMRSAEVAQPWVEWPAYDELPELLRADKHPPRASDGAIVRPDGTRVFLLNPYTREDQGVDLQEKEPWGLYDPASHGWIYRELLTLESLSRLGFNSLSVTMPPSPWWRHLGSDKKDYRDPALLPATRDRVRVPFYVDTVCWPYTLGVPAREGWVGEDAITRGRNHWVPYRITGEGRDTWLRMWRLYARRYAGNNVPVLMYELFNEPAYCEHDTDHHRGFAAWLERRHQSIEQLNRCWGTALTDWTEAADCPEDGGPEGQRLDYDEYLAGRFAELVRDGVAEVRRHLPDALAGVQPMGGYVRRPREAVWKHLIVPHETVVLTPTGGGSWTPGGGDREPPARALDAGIAAAPFENDLLLAMAGDKMIVDNEFYSRGNDARSLHDQLWRHVIVGLDGISMFSWAKRGWAWHKGRDMVIDEAENFPYSMLNPAARPTASLRGIHDFARAIQPVSHLVLPKPWGPAPRIALVHSWSNVRRRVLHPELPDKTETYHQALRFSHWNTQLVPTDRILRDGSLDGFPLVIVAGVTHVEPALLPILREHVRNGGTLVIGEAMFDRDLYGHPVEHGLAGVTVGDDRGPATISGDSAATPALAGELEIPRGVPALELAPGTEPLLRDNRGRPLITRRSEGAGRVYYQAADAAGYPLARLLWTILDDAAPADPAAARSWRLAELRTPDGELATNILLSRRSHPADGYHVLLMMNEDRHAKTFRTTFAPGPGEWRVREPISGRDLGRLTGEALERDGFELTLDPGRPAVVLVEHQHPQ